MARGAGRRASVAAVERALALHEALMADGVRNRAFQRALARLPLRGAAVLDIGAGCGVWSVSAALLGASRVVAVERDALLVPLIRRLAAENGVADRIRVVHGDSRRVSLRREFDLVVSETVGQLGFDEGIVSILADARARFLRPGGTLIPQHLALLASPVRLRAGAPRARGAGLRVRTASLRDLAVHVPRNGRCQTFRPLAPAARLVDVDLRRARAELPLLGLAARWRLAEPRRLHAVAVWVELRLAPRVVLSTLAGTSWRPRLFPVEPFAAGPGTLQFALSLGPGPLRWDVSFTAEGRTESRRYSPLFACGSLAGAR